MSVDLRRLRELAAETGFRAETLEKVIRLGEIAGDVARHPLLSRALVLKGGTAINLCFGEPRRLSVDLDFNYVGSLEKAAMEAERPEVERALQIIAQGRGYAIQQSADQHGDV
jgi:predicted nucleotidyltransferase component of viral defense system